MSNNSDLTSFKRNVTCNNCGWVHIAVTKKYAKDQTNQFGDWIDSQNGETRSYYGLKAGDKYDRHKHFRDYQHCFRCGGHYKNFRESKDGDCPRGCTIGPILDYAELEPGGISF